MARQKGIFPITGTLDGVNFYFRKGVPVARMAGGGFNGKAIRTSAAMTNVRQNMSEFGRCATLTKHMRRALRMAMAPYNDTTWHGRLMQLWQEIKTYDRINARGERQPGIGFMSPEGERAFREFSFTPGKSTVEAMGRHYTFDRALTSLAFEPIEQSFVRFPENSRLMGLQLLVMTFDFSSPKVEFYAGSEMLLRAQDAATALVLSCVQPNHGLPHVVLLRRIFYQESGGGTVAMRADAGLELIACLTDGGIALSL